MSQVLTTQIEYCGDLILFLGSVLRRWWPLS